MSESFFYHALKVDKERCFGCSLCMRNCPTEAIRVRNGKAEIYGNHCIDCGECFRVCPTGAIYVAQDDFESIYNFKTRVVLMPTVFPGQFSEDISASLIHSILLDIGFTHVAEVESSVMIYSKLTNQYLRENPDKKPAISSFCPAILRLIQVKFPSLVDNLVPIKTPVDLTAMYIKEKLLKEGHKEEDIGIFYITPCAAKIAATKSPVGEDKSSVDGVLNMDTMFNKVQKRIKNLESGYKIKTMANDLNSDCTLFATTNGERRLNIGKKSFAIDEVHNVIDFLDKVENDEVEDLDFLELRSCDQGCPGGILTIGNRFLINDRVNLRAKKLAFRERQGITTRQKDIHNYREELANNSRVGKILPRSMMVLDKDISIAFEKLTKIKELEAMLPHIDCSMCGAPSCRALAEDIACETASLGDCVFIQKNLELRGSMTLDESIETIKKIWGGDIVDEHIFNK